MGQTGWHRADRSPLPAGVWADAVGRMAGVKVPLVAMHHAYVVTERIEGIQVGAPEPGHGGLAGGGVGPGWGLSTYTWVARVCGWRSVEARLEAARASREHGARAGASGWGQ